jgi:hypothetical protein
MLTEELGKHRIRSEGSTRLLPSMECSPGPSPSTQRTGASPAAMERRARSQQRRQQRQDARASPSASQQVAEGGVSPMAAEDKVTQWIQSQPSQLPTPKVSGFAIGSLAGKLSDQGSSAKLSSPEPEPEPERSGPELAEGLSVMSLARSPSIGLANHIQTAKNVAKAGRDSQGVGRARASPPPAEER